jgi:SNF2 family DNA or RNA helicase
MIDPKLWNDGIMSKLNTLIEYIETQIPENEQIIIYSTFRNGQRSAQWALEKAGISSMLFDEKTVDEFKNGDYRVLCSTVRKGGVGLNLYNADWVIFLDLPWSTVDYRQARERVRANNKQGTVVVVNMIAKDTVDEYVYNNILTKLSKVKESEVVKQVISGYLELQSEMKP